MPQHHARSRQGGMQGLPAHRIAGQFDDSLLSFGIRSLRCA